MSYWWMTFPRFVTIVSSTRLCFRHRRNVSIFAVALSRISRVNRHIKMLIKRESQRRAQRIESGKNAKNLNAEIQRSFSQSLAAAALLCRRITFIPEAQFNFKWNSILVGMNLSKVGEVFLCVHLQRSMASKEDFLILFLLLCCVDSLKSWEREAEECWKLRAHDFRLLKSSSSGDFLIARVLRREARLSGARC